MSAGWLINSLRTTYNHSSGYNVPLCVFTQIRDYAARKGTREKARKKKVKQIVEKVGFIPHNQRVGIGLKRVAKVPPNHLIDDSSRELPIDNVWILRYHRRPVYSFQELIEIHREMNHPTVYNEPNAFVNAHFDLDMQREKKTRFLEKYTKFVEAVHPFEQKEEKAILALCKTPEEQRNAKGAGADFVGGVELIKQIQGGNFSYKEFDYIVAHIDILPDLLLIRGLLKKKFPNAKMGNLGTDMGGLVRKFKQGIQYTAKPLEDFKNFGQIDVTFGTLNMEIKQLQENLVALINDVEEMKPRKNAPFILRLLIKCPPSPLPLKLDLEQYISSKSDEEIEDEDDNTSAVIASH